MKAGTFAISWGRYGGFYSTGNEFAKRIALGWVALTWVDTELDDMMKAYVAEHDLRSDMEWIALETGLLLSMMQFNDSPQSLSARSILDRARTALSRS